MLSTFGNWPGHVRVNHLNNKRILGSPWPPIRFLFNSNLQKIETTILIVHCNCKLEELTISIQWAICLWGWSAHSKAPYIINTEQVQIVHNFMGANVMDNCIQLLYTVCDKIVIPSHHCNNWHAIEFYCRDSPVYCKHHRDLEKLNLCIHSMNSGESLKLIFPVFIPHMCEEHSSAESQPSKSNLKFPLSNAWQQSWQEFARRMLRNKVLALVKIK